MMRVVIVDDQELVLQGLSDLIAWEEIGLTIIGCFSSPHKALDFICREQPDVVITDIRMPGMNGLELIEALYVANQRPEFILISSYRDFDAAKEAIRLGVNRYILKPFEEDEVRSTLSQLQNRLRNGQEMLLLDGNTPNSIAQEKILAKAAAYKRCFLLLCEWEYLLSDGPGVQVTPVRVSGYPAAWMISQAADTPVCPENCGLSGMYTDFSKITEMISAAESALRGAFSFSDNALSASVQRFLSANLANPPSLVDLTGMFFLSKTRLCAMFHRHTGFSPISFLQHVRLYTSRWHLLHSDMRIREIAQLVGYEDSSYFGKLYKREFGLSPEEFRLRHSLML